MTALTVQNPCYKCDWETRMTIDKKIIAEIIIIIYREVLLRRNPPNGVVLAMKSIERRTLSFRETT